MVAETVEYIESLDDCETEEKRCELNSAEEMTRGLTNDESENVAILVSSSSRLVLNSSAGDVHHDTTTVVELEMRKDCQLSQYP